MLSQCFQFIWFMILLFPDVLLSIKIENNKPISLNNNYQCGKFEVLFAIDQSSSLGLYLFQKQINLIEEIVQKYFHYQNNSVGIIQFGTESTVTDPIRMRTNKDFLRRLNQIRENYWPNIVGGQYTNTPQMLEQAMDTFLISSANSNPKILIIITDGTPCTHQCGCTRIGCSICPNGRNPPGVLTWPGSNINKQFSSKLYKKFLQTDIHPIIIAVGMDVIKENMDCILKNPSSQYIHAGDLEKYHINQILPKLNAMCPPVVTPKPTLPPIDSKCKAGFPLNIIFGIDQSSSLEQKLYNDQIDLMKNIVEKKLFKKNNFSFIEFGSDIEFTNFSDMNYNNVVHKLNNIEYWPTNGIKSQIQYSNMEAMFHSALNLFNQKHSNNLLIVVTDGNPCVPQCRCQSNQDGCSICPNGGPNPIKSTLHKNTTINSVFDPTLWKKVLNSNITVVIVGVGEDVSKLYIDCMLKNPTTEYIQTLSLQKKEIKNVLSKISHTICKFQPPIITKSPTSVTNAPTRITQIPTNQTIFPTFYPSSNPTFAPPTKSPTFAPPTKSPTFAPPTKSPTFAPTTKAPTSIPTQSTNHPSVNPTPDPTTRNPTIRPTSLPSSLPTYTPTKQSDPPTQAPTLTPTNSPTLSPTQSPLAEGVDFRGICYYDSSLDKKTNTRYLIFNVNGTLCNNGDEPVRHIRVTTTTYLPGSISTKSKMFGIIHPRRKVNTQNCVHSHFEWSVTRKWDFSPVGRTFVSYKAVGNRGKLFRSRPRTLFNGWCAPFQWPK